MSEPPEPAPAAVSSETQQPASPDDFDSEIQAVKQLTAVDSGQDRPSSVEMDASVKAIDLATVPNLASDEAFLSPSPPLANSRKTFLDEESPDPSGTQPPEADQIPDVSQSLPALPNVPAADEPAAAAASEEAASSSSQMSLGSDNRNTFFKRLGQRTGTVSVDSLSSHKATVSSEKLSLLPDGNAPVNRGSSIRGGSGRKLGDNRVSLATRASHKSDNIMSPADRASLLDLANRQMSIISARGESSTDFEDAAEGDRTSGLNIPDTIPDHGNPEEDSQTVPLLGNEESQSPGRESIPAVKGGGSRMDKTLKFDPNLSATPSMMDYNGKNSDFGQKANGMTSVFDFKEDDTAEWRQRISKFVDAWPTTIFFVGITIWALFGDDIRLAICPPSADPVFVVLTYTMLAAFTAEMIMFSVVKRNYIFSFYFWLDLIATASLIFDIPDLNEAILQAGSSDSADSTTLARAGRTSRVGTRAGRIARVVRVIRLVRMLKIYKVLSAHLTKIGQKKNRTRVHEKHDEDLDEDGNPRTAESRVGVKLTELTTRRVIIGVLLMLFMLPVFNVQSGYYGEPVLYEEEGLTMLHNVYVMSPDSLEFNVSLVTYISNVGYAMGMKTTGGVIHLEVANETYVPAKLDSSDRRLEEITSYQVTSCGNDEADLASQYSDTVASDECLVSLVVIDNKWVTQFEAILNMCRTIFTCVILGVGALLFSKDANALVLHPLERMVQKVKEMSENPLAKMQIRAVATKDEQQMETRILENSITKICSLLAVGFGDAGAEVVAENIRNGGDLNPMVPGHRMMAIFGFCDIRRFTDATEVLQEEVMEFVNSIAKIVHMEVSLHGGSANKNIGDAFLLVWKLPAQLMSTADDLVLAASQLPADKRESVAYLADRALAAFVVIHVALKRSPRLKQFCMRSDIRKRMGNGFRVSMGFGLHIGWAIEGAIGSEYKIDASYLSPNVNMASRLEAATKQFGCSILMSDDFAMMLSPRVRKLCRAIDVITVKGSNKPVTLYTYDISLSLIAEPDENQMNEDSMENLSHSFLSFKSEFEENPDITQTIGSSQEYRDQFQKGFQSYLDGKWEDAKDQLLQCLNRMDPSGSSVTDGPTASLLEVMGRTDFLAPNSWKGMRHLTDK